MRVYVWIVTRENTLSMSSLDGLQLASQCNLDRMQLALHLFLSFCTCIVDLRVDV
jgi:hypothetical protein